MEEYYPEKSDAGINFDLFGDMKIIIFSILIILSDVLCAQEASEIFEAKVAQKGQIQHGNDLQELIDGEKWGWHSGKLGLASASSSLAASSHSTYDVANIHDLDLRTAWVEGASDYGVGECISFILDNGMESDDPYTFTGLVEIFNGYCKSEVIWKANSRVKSFNLFLNEELIARINLLDTWQYQTVDLRCLFDVSLRRSGERIHKLQNGDILKFEIAGVYPGSKYQDVAISELVFDSEAN